MKKFSFDLFIRLFLFYFFSLFIHKYLIIDRSIILGFSFSFFIISFFKKLQLFIYFSLLGFLFFHIKESEDYDQDNQSGKIILEIKEDVSQSNNQYLSRAEIIGIYGKEWQMGKGNIHIMGDSLRGLKKGTLIEMKYFQGLNRVLFTNSSFRLISKPPSSLLSSFKNKLLGSLDSVKNKQDRAVLKTIVFSDKSELDLGIKALYQNAGASHFLSVSGLHVGILFSVLSLIFSPFKKWGSFFRFLFWLIIIGILVFYGIMVGGAAPILRASFMFSTILFARLFFKPYQAFHILFFSAFMILWHDFKQLGELGFILSFLAVAGILFFQLLEIGKVKEPLRGIHTRIFRFIIEISLIGIAAQVFTLPIIILYFHKLPNLILYFVLNPIVAIGSSFVLISTYIYLIISYFIYLPILGSIISFEIHFLHQIFYWANDLFGKGLDWIGLNLWEVFLYYCLVIVFFYWFKRRKNQDLVLLKLIIMVFISSFFMIRIWRINKKPVSMIQTYRSSIIHLDIVHQTGIITIQGSDCPSEQWLDYRFKDQLSYYFVRDTLIRFRN